MWEAVGVQILNMEVGSRLFAVPSSYYFKEFQMLLVNCPLQTCYTFRQDHFELSSKIWCELRLLTLDKSLLFVCKIFCPTVRELQL